MSSLVVPPTYSNSYGFQLQPRAVVSRNSVSRNSEASSYNPNNLVNVSYRGNMVFEKLTTSASATSMTKVIPMPMSDPMQGAAAQQDRQLLQQQQPGGLFGSAKKWFGNMIARSSSSSSLDMNVAKPPTVLLTTAVTDSPLNQMRPIGSNVQNATAISVGPFNIPLATPFKFFSTNKLTGAVEYRQVPMATPEQDKQKERSSVSNIS